MEEVIEFVLKIFYVKFDEMVEVYVRLNVDLRYVD